MKCLYEFISFVAQIQNQTQTFIDVHYHKIESASIFSFAGDNRYRVNH